MPACDPSGLLAGAVGFQDLSEPQLHLVQIALLEGILGATQDPAGLIAASKQFQDLSKLQLETVKAQLLCNILAGA